MNLILTVILASVAPNSLAVLNKNFDVAGSGVLLARQMVLTAAHVVKNTETIVACGGDLIKGHLVRFDARYDLALVALEKPCNAVKLSPFASQDAEKGLQITVQGYPNGRQSLGFGSVQDYAALPGDFTRDYMLLDATIQPGNSGGPVLSASGELVGMVQGKICYSRDSDVCRGTAIPLKTIKKFFLELSQ